MDSSLDPNERFIWFCLRNRWEAGALEHARQLALNPQFHWETVQNTIRTNSLGPLIYSVLAECAWIPVPVLQSLQKAYLECLTRNTLLLREAELLLQAFNNHGIDTIFLKGAALVATCYQNPGLRPMIDLDILVKQPDVKKATDILGGLGYDFVKSEVSQHVQVNLKNEIVMQRTTKINSVIEVHWSLFDSTFYQTTLPMEWFWQTAKSMQLNRLAAWSLGPEAQLLHLCGHVYFHHQSRGFLRYHDIAEWIVRYQDEINWGVLLERGREFYLLRPLKQILGTVNELYPSIIPIMVMEKLLSADESALERSLYTQSIERRESVGKRFIHDLNGLAGWRKRFRFAWDHIFPSVAYMRERYHIRYPVTVVFYYPYRWYLGFRSIFVGK